MSPEVGDSRETLAYFLHLQEYLLAVEEVEEEPADKDKAGFEYYCAPEWWQVFGKTAQEELVDRLKREDALCHIDGYGVHSDNGEWF